MTTTYEQPTPERCVKSMKKSGKLAVALFFVAVGVFLLLFGNRVGKDTTSQGGEPPSEAFTYTVEEGTATVAPPSCFSTNSYARDSRSDSITS